MSTATLANNIILTSDWFKQSLARAVPGAWYDSETKAWSLSDPTPRSAAVALRLFPELGLKHPELNALRDELATEVRPFDRATEYGRPVRAPRVRAAMEQL